MIAKKSKFLFSGEKQDVTAAGEGWGQIQIRSSDRPEVGEEAAKGADYPSQGGRSRLREVEERGVDAGAGGAAGGGFVAAGTERSSTGLSASRVFSTRTVIRMTY